MHSKQEESPGEGAPREPDCFQLTPRGTVGASAIKVHTTPQHTQTHTFERFLRQRKPRGANTSGAPQEKCSATRVPSSSWSPVPLI